VPEPGTILWAAGLFIAFFSHRPNRGQPAASTC
jgi:hypothetical protein